MIIKARDNPARENESGEWVRAGEDMTKRAPLASPQEKEIAARMTPLGLTARRAIGGVMERTVTKGGNPQKGPAERRSEMALFSEEVKERVCPFTNIAALSAIGSSPSR